jgi:hypothetical protein
MRRLLLAALGLAAVVMAAIIADDLVTSSRDRWAAVMFAAGSLFAAGLGRWRRGRGG